MLKRSPCPIKSQSVTFSISLLTDLKWLLSQPHFFPVPKSSAIYFPFTDFLIQSPFVNAHGIPALAFGSK